MKRKEFLLGLIGLPAAFFLPKLSEVSQSSSDKSDKKFEEYVDMTKYGEPCYWSEFQNEEGITRWGVFDKEHNLLVWVAVE